MESFLILIWLLVNSDYGSISSVVLLIVMLVLWRHSKARLKGLLELLGSTDGNGSGTLEGNSLASNIGYLLNKYILTWESRGATLSQVLDRCGDVERALDSVLEKADFKNDADEEEQSPPYNPNAFLLDDDDE